jgi:hypothetical protein
MITDRNQVCFDKMSVCGVQEVVLRRKFGRGAMTLRTSLSILNYSVNPRDTYKPYLFNKLNYTPGHY